MLTIAATAVLVGCWIYCILAIAAALRHARMPGYRECGTPAAISILKSNAATTRVTELAAVEGI